MSRVTQPQEGDMLILCGFDVEPPEGWRKVMTANGAVLVRNVLPPPDPYHPEAKPRRRAGRARRHHK